MIIQIYKNLRVYGSVNMNFPLTEIKSKKKKRWEKLFKIHDETRGIR